MQGLLISVFTSCFPLAGRLPNGPQACSSSWGDLFWCEKEEEGTCLPVLDDTNLTSQRPRLGVCLSWLLFPAQLLSFTLFKHLYPICPFLRPGFVRARVYFSTWQKCLSNSREIATFTFLLQALTGWRHSLILTP